MSGDDRGVSSDRRARTTQFSLDLSFDDRGERQQLAVKNRWPDRGVWLLDCPYRSARFEGQVCDVLPPLDRRGRGPAIDPFLPLPMGSSLASHLADLALVAIGTSSTRGGHTEVGTLK